MGRLVWQCGQDGWAGGRQVLERLGWEVARVTDVE